MARPTQPIKLTEEQTKLLQRLARRRGVAHQLVLRSQIVLKAADGVPNKAISRELKVGEDCVGIWRRRWIEGRQDLEQAAGNSRKLELAVSVLLSDKARCGSPRKFSAEQECQIIALTCEAVPEHLTHWTRGDLVREAVKRGITKSISKTTIGRFLKSGGPKAASQAVLDESRAGKRGRVSSTGAGNL